MRNQNIRWYLFGFTVLLLALGSLVYFLERHSTRDSRYRDYYEFRFGK